MADERQLWWHLRERLAAQAWSCDDTTWEIPAVGGTVGSLLARYAEAGLTTRLEVARSLQQLSEDRPDPDVGRSDDITTAWLDLRRIDGALGRPPIDLRSEVALFAGTRLLEQLVTALSAAGTSATVTISGPGFVASVEEGARPGDCIATLSWPTFVRLAAGTLKIVDSEMDLAGSDQAIDAFLDALTNLKRL